MTSLRQIDANRRNSDKSTARRPKVRHGLCAETVIEILEDVDDYKAFEATITSDYEAQTAVERELVLRLASYCGVSAGLLQSRIYSASRPKCCAIAGMDANRRTI